MTSILTIIENGSALLAWVILIAAFAVLCKGADVFVDSAVALAERMRIPKLIIGIALVSVATTTPEISVSLFAAAQGQPEMAMGNAIGSVMCDCGMALALCAIISRKPIPILPYVLKITGCFLASMAALAFLFVAFDHRLGHMEGLVLVLCFAGYITFLIRQQKRGRMQAHMDLEPFEDEITFSLGRVILMFILGLGAIILSSRFIVVSSINIARAAGIPEAVIALSLVAIGTSIPEVATSIMSARKGHGDLCVGNILGADIMNLCLVAGGSALVSGLTIDARQIYFMFPAMFIMLGTTLLLLRTRHSLNRKEGIVLFCGYAAYLGALAWFTAIQ